MISLYQFYSGQDVSRSWMKIYGTVDGNSFTVLTNEEAYFPMRDELGNFKAWGTIDKDAWRGMVFQRQDGEFKQRKIKSFCFGRKKYKDFIQFNAPYRTN